MGTRPKVLFGEHSNSGQLLPKVAKEANKHGNRGWPSEIGVRITLCRLREA